MPKANRRRNARCRRQAESVWPGAQLLIREHGLTSDDRRDLTSRAVSLRLETIDESNRSIRCTIATDNIVTVFDWREYRLIDEVLLVSGFSHAPHVNLLDNHRATNDDILGSLTDFDTSNGTIDCRLNFADMSSLSDNDSVAQKVERAWLRAKQGHQRNVSAGYQVLESTTIEPNKRQMVAGRMWTAGERPLRISTKWLLREGSLTPIGADHDALTRSQEIEPVNKKLRKYLETLGLRADAIESDAWAFYGSLTGEQRSEAEKLNERSMPTFVPPTTANAGEDGDNSDPTPAGTVSGTRSAATGNQGNQQNGNSGAGTQGQRSQNGNSAPPAGAFDLSTVDGQRQYEASILQRENQRRSSLEELFGDTEPELLRTYLNDSTMTAERAAPELARRLRQSLGQAAAPNGETGGHVGIHSRGFESDVTLEALQGALLMRTAENRELASLEHDSLGSLEAMALNIPQFLRSDINDDNRQRQMENAVRLRGISMIRLCEYALRIGGHQVPHDEGEIVQRAFSTNSLEPIFTTSVNARLLASYTDAPDTTQAWTATEEVGNFKENERSTMGKVGRLTKHGRGGTADMTDIDATQEKYRIARYSQQWAIDEMDVIDDHFGSANTFTPEDMGRAAAQLRPDLVYAILLANPTLLATGRALFNSTDGNTGAGGLTIPNLEAAEAWFGDQRIKGRPLNLMLRCLLVPRQLRWLAARITSSAEIRDDTGSAGRYSVSNPISGEPIDVVVDSRLGAGGVIDPNTGATYTGSATGWYATVKPGEQGAKTIIVGYRRGTGRAPMVRSSLLKQGQWGYHYDIKHDIGATPLDWRGFKRHTG